MNKTNNWKTGQVGENLAAKFLEEKGYEILSRNYRTRFGEIDIIAKAKVEHKKATKCATRTTLSSDISQPQTKVVQDKTKNHAQIPWQGYCGDQACEHAFCLSEPQKSRNDIYVFVEVKTKIGDQFGTPEEMINSGKIAKVLKMASVYLTKEGLGERPCRLDAIAIVLDNEMKVISFHHYPCIT